MGYNKTIYSYPRDVFLQVAQFMELQFSGLNK